jgi:hypothetical protein
MIVELIVPALIGSDNIHKPVRDVHPQTILNFEGAWRTSMNPLFNPKKDRSPRERRIARWNGRRRRFRSNLYRKAEQMSLTNLYSLEWKRTRWTPNLRFHGERRRLPSHTEASLPIQISSPGCSSAWSPVDTREGHIWMQCDLAQILRYQITF